MNEPIIINYKQFPLEMFAMADTVHHLPMMYDAEELRISQTNIQTFPRDESGEFFAVPSAKLEVLPAHVYFVKDQSIAHDTSTVIMVKHDSLEKNEDYVVLKKKLVSLYEEFGRVDSSSVDGTSGELQVGFTSNDDLEAAIRSVKRRLSEIIRSHHGISTYSLNPIDIGVDFPTNVI